MCEPIIKEVQVKNILSKTNLPIGEFLDVKFWNEIKNPKKFYGEK